MDIEDNGESNLDTNIKVAVRVRPLNSKERANAEPVCVKVFPEQIVMTNPANTSEEHSFAFDLVFPEDISQVEVWNKVGLPILNKAIAGYNSTIFAYGQTGSGKTWSMQGGEGDLQGIIPRMNSSLFERIAEERKTRPSIQFLVTISYFEIYNEVIADLLDASDRKKKSAVSKGGLEIKEHPALGVYVKGLQEIVVESASKMATIVDQGMRNRTVASTQMNADSSRSHSVFMITVHQKDEEDPSKNIFAKINLVDLAGSERVKSTGATGATLKEGANINKSLSALGNVINALVEAGKGKATFIPYRNSKLTRVLQESLGGNSVTAMLAAMSPASCNFDETLSTLKYANRAKAIKVKAIKNEEASAVSRLNDEIRVLKEKLSQQGGGGGDTGVGSEKNQQQLRELEEAVRNTWESKSKMSAEHEQERQRLLQEQQVAAQQLQSAKERSWLLLEQKDLVELTLSHVKELTKNMHNVSPDVEGWAENWSKLVALEKLVGEQFTVIQVFRTSLEKDSSQLTKAINTKDSQRKVDDSFVTNNLNQLKEKIGAIIDEVSKWSVTQHSFHDVLGDILHNVKAFALSYKHEIAAQDNTNSPEIADANDHEEEQVVTQADKYEVLRGLTLMTKQLQSKQRLSRESLGSAQIQLCNFKTLLKDLKALVFMYNNLLNNPNFGDANTTASANMVQELKKLVSQLEKQIIHVESKEVKLEDSANEEHGLQKITTAPLAFSIDSHQLDYTSMKAIISDAKKDSKKDTTINSSTCYVSVHEKQNTLRLKLYESAKLSSIKIGGCRYQGNKTISSEETEKLITKTSSLAKVGQLSIHEVKLPCGVGLPECNGEIETTTATIADILDWTVLLKKNSPDKFLKRPPVRFLFDLFKYIAELFPGYLPSNIQNGDWAVVGATKESKTEFMEEIIQFVQKELKDAEPITTGSSIITGSDPELTNKLIQQTAICVYANVVLKKTPDDKREELDVAILKNLVSKVAEVKEKKVVTSAWLKTVKIVLLDEQQQKLSWEAAGCKDPSNITTNLKSHDGVFVLDLSKAVQARYIEVTPVDWHNSEFASIPAMKVEVVGYSESMSENKLPPILEEKILINSIRTVEDALNNIISLVSKITHYEQSEKARKQEEAKKNMEMLAQEKAALAQSLATEKESLMTNNQDLTEQLKKCFNQLQETAALLDKEQQLNLELETGRLQIEEEKAVLQKLLRDQEQENSKLQTLLLKLEASLEKERSAAADMQKALDEKQEVVDSLQGDLQYATKSRDVLEQERDDLQNQIAVLIEERDTARSHEEDLFEKLTDVTNDLERLQESYVNIADRCNDAQDEVSELRDQIESLQDALAMQRAAFQQQTMAVVKPPTVASSEPKPVVDNAANQSKRSGATSKSLPTGLNQKTIKPEIFVSADDSKSVLTKTSSAGGNKLKNADEDYQEDFEDEYNEEE